MKRNKLMRSASILFALALVTTSLVSGTYAKYITEDSVKDEARVAKWGVVITGSGSLFSDAYINKAGTNIPTTWNSDYKTDSNGSANITVSTASVGGDNLVAPGTKSNESGLNFAISGKPEVTTAVTINFTAQDIYLAEGTYATLQDVSLTATEFASEISESTIVIYTYDSQNSKYVQVTSTDTYNPSTKYYKLVGIATVAEGGYKPVMYKYNSGDSTDATAIAGSIATTLVGTTSIADTDTKIESGKSIADYDTDKTTAGVKYTITKTYNPNTDLSGLIGTSGANNISWSWDFESSSTDNAVKANVDREDTILGNLAAGSKVVLIASDRTLTELQVNAGTGIASSGVAGQSGYKEYASIRTSFDIDITATQVD